MTQPFNFREAFAKPLKAAGFKKKRPTTWYRDGAETICVVNLQKSPYGNEFYVNIGLWLKALGDNDKPVEYHCHIRTRWEELIPEDEFKIKRLLDLEDMSMFDEDRVKEIPRLLQSYIFPFFAKVDTLKKIRAMYGTPTWPVGLVLIEARDFILNKK